MAVVGAIERLISFNGLCSVVDVIDQAIDRRLSLKLSHKGRRHPKVIFLKGFSKYYNDSRL
jgi:hypothetical protein